MKTPSNRLLVYLGTVIWGDLGPNTMYRSARHKLVVFAKAPPKTPPSPMQLDLRNAWRAAITAWNALTPAQRATWALAARRACLHCSGFNLWIHWKVVQHEPTIRTIERLSRLSLLP